MLSGPFAVIADIHGNSWALEAVLADIKRRSILRILNLGDCVYGPLDPAGIIGRLEEWDVVSVRGNQDRHLWQPRTPPGPGSTMEFVISSLSDFDRLWLSNQYGSQTLEEEKVLLLHGNTQFDDAHLLEDIRPEGVFLRPLEDLEREVGQLGCEVVLCAHSHVPRVVWAGGTLVMNPGSVGLPAYTDDLPYPHAMQTGSPHARYAVLARESGATGWQVEHVAVPYDWNKAAEVARRNGRADWAGWIASGRAQVS